MKTLLKDQEQIVLLKEMFAACEFGTNEFEYKRFRATHHQKRDVIDGLEKVHFIERSGSLYKLNLIALAELEEIIPECKMIVDVCEVIFQDLKREYLQEPDQTIFLVNIGYRYNIPPEYVYISTPYFLQASIFSSYRIDENMGACVVTREEILDYENFRQCIERMQEYSLQSLQSFAEFHNVPQASYFSSSLDFSLTDLKPFLHPEIIKHSYSHYKNGHLREAVLNSIMALSELIRDKT